MTAQPLANMVALDEEIEARHPGFMTGKPECEQMIAGKDGWSDWIHPLPGYLMQCCDCNLIHEMQTAIVPAHNEASATSDGEDADHIVVFRMRRHVT